jgi:membrane dipeptidase
VTATLEQIAVVRELARRYPDTFELATTAADVERIFQAGRIASLIGMEGGHSIDSSLGTLRMFRALGAASMTLTHSEHVPWADSSAGAARLGGLSPFGEEVVREMNWLGMLVDISHVSPDTMTDAMRVSEAPVIFSHSSARAICDVHRNVPDEVLRLLPEDGGVIMITFVPEFVAPAAAEFSRRQQTETARLRGEHPGISTAALEERMRLWRTANPPPAATLAMVADHIDHARKVAGIDHVGIGSDFDGITRTPQGLEDVAAFPALIAELLRRGYADEDVKKILGLNVLRVLREAERVAARLQTARGPSFKTIEQLDGQARPPAPLQ